MDNRKLILIIEDNDKNMKLMRDLLQYHSYDTVEATNAEDGLRIALDNPPDLILLDIQLPGMNGIEALKRLREDATMENVPVVAVTASVMTHDRNELIRAGFNDCQPKPIEIKSFVERVATFLAGS